MRNLLIIVLVAGCDVVGEGYRGMDFADGGMTEDQDLEDDLDLVDREVDMAPTAPDDLSWGDPCTYAYGTLGCPCAHDCCLGTLACDVDTDVCYDPTDPERLPE